MNTTRIASISLTLIFFLQTDDTVHFRVGCDGQIYVMLSPLLAGWFVGLLPG